MRIAAYCRVSTDKAEQLDSLANQKQFFSEFAARGSHTLVGIYADEGISGTSLKRRTEFQRLMADAERGVFDAVAVKDISRFARNTVDFLQSIRRLKALGINTMFLNSNMESLGESEFILTLFSALAQEESINLSKRVKFGKKINAQRGRVPSRIFGYDRIDNFTLEINQSEAGTIRHIYRLYLGEGYGCSRIADELNQLGYRTKMGCEWNARSVRRVLANPIYCGDHINNKYEIQDCLQGRQVRLPAEQNIHHSRPQWAIISSEEFSAAQAKMGERRGKYVDTGEQMRERQSDRHLFSSLMRCECCGHSFYQKSYTYAKKRTYWKCQINDTRGVAFCANNVTVTQEWLLEQIKNYILYHVDDREEFARCVIKRFEEQGSDAVRSGGAAELRSHAEHLKLKRTKYEQMYAAGIISMADLADRVNVIDAEMELLLQRCEAISTRLDRTVEELIADVEGFLSFDKVTNYDLKKLISAITVSRDGEIKIFWRAPDELSNFSMPI